MLTYLYHCKEAQDKQKITNIHTETRLSKVSDVVVLVSFMNICV